MDVHVREGCLDQHFNIGDQLEHCINDIYIYMYPLLSASHDLRVTFVQ